MGTKEGRSEFCNQFFHSVGFISKASGEVAVHTGAVAGPVGEFVKQGGIVPFGTRDRVCAGKEVFFGHLDVIRAWQIKGVLAAVADICAGIVNKCVSSFVLSYRIDVFRKLYSREFVSVYLGGIEYPESSGNSAHFFIAIFIGFAGSIFLVEDDCRGFLAFAYLCVCFLPLFVGSPAIIEVAFDFGGSP